MLSGKKRFRRIPTEDISGSCQISDPIPMLCCDLDRFPGFWWILETRRRREEIFSLLLSPDTEERSKSQFFGGIGCFGMRRNRTAEILSRVESGGSGKAISSEYVGTWGPLLWWGVFFNIRQSRWIYGLRVVNWGPCFHSVGIQIQKHADQIRAVRLRQGHGGWLQLDAGWAVGVAATRRGG